MTISVKAISTRVPESSIKLKDFYEYLRPYFDEAEDEAFLARLIPKTGIETKHWTVDVPNFFFTDGGQPKYVGHTERQALWREQTRQVCASIGKELLSKAQVSPRDVGLVSFNSTTGYSNPDMPALVAAELDLPHSTRRTQILGMGCYGGIPNLVRCVESLESGRCREYAMQLTSELCSFTFQPKVKDPEYKVAMALFSDGSAGMLLGKDGGLAEIQDFDTYTDYQTFGEMSFEFADEGQNFVLSKNVPKYIGMRVSEPVNRILARNNLEIRDVDWLIHPGGLAIVRAVCEALKLDIDRAIPETLEVNRSNGNMSSASIFFCLKEYLEAHKNPKEHAMMLGFGPGLTIEAVLLKIPDPSADPGPIQNADPGSAHDDEEKKMWEDWLEKHIA
jgi:predicted naringenin-chalcone synthase